MSYTSIEVVERLCELKRLIRNGDSNYLKIYFGCSFKGVELPLETEIDRKKAILKIDKCIKKCQKAILGKWSELPRLITKD